MKKAFWSFNGLLCCILLSGCSGPPRDDGNFLIGDWHCSYTRDLSYPESLALDTSDWGKYEFRKNNKVTISIDDFITKAEYSYGEDFIKMEEEKDGKVYTYQYWKLTSISEDENEFSAIEEYNGPDAKYTCSRNLE